jgi:cytoskeletal protein CcmA (bactofilin family)
MAHDSSTTDPGGGRRSESLELLKQVAGFTKAKPPEVVMTPLPKPAPNGARKGALPTIISVNVELGGQIVSPEELHIYGTVEGDVRAAAVVVCPGGMVHGEVVAESVTVQGTVEGRIHGQSVQLAAGGIVRGDIIHAELGIEKGAMFEGASRRLQDPLKDAPAIAVRKKGE